MSIIKNEWITLKTELNGNEDAKRNGVIIQRKFAGLDARIEENENAVTYCKIYYWERELYPNGEPIKTELKYYNLQNLPYSEIEENGVVYYMEPLNVLDSFVENLGNPGIINPSRLTLSNISVLPLSAPDGYPLKKDTREKILKPLE